MPENSTDIMFVEAEKASKGSMHSKKLSVWIVNTGRGQVHRKGGNKRVMRRKMQMQKCMKNENNTRKQRKHGNENVG